jgi:tetratricopeptide (TPR) repeat protein
MVPSYVSTLPRSELLYAGGLWLLDRARPQDASHFFRALLVEAPEDERGWLGLGACHEQIGQDDQAYELYLSGFAAARRKTRCGIAMARVLRRAGDIGRADRALEMLEDYAQSEELEDLLADERRVA